MAAVEAVRAQSWRSMRAARRNLARESMERRLAVVEDRLAVARQRVVELKQGIVEEWRWIVTFDRDAPELACRLRWLVPGIMAGFAGRRLEDRRIRFLRNLAAHQFGYEMLDMEGWSLQRLTAV